MKKSLASGGQEASGKTTKLFLATISVTLPITGKKAMMAGLNLQVTVQCDSVKDLQVLLHKNVDELFENWDAESFGIKFLTIEENPHEGQATKTVEIDIESTLSPSKAEVVK